MKTGQRYTPPNPPHPHMNPCFQYETENVYWRTRAELNAFCISVQYVIDYSYSVSGQDEEYFAPLRYGA